MLPVASPICVDNRLEAGVNAVFDRLVADGFGVIDTNSAVLGEMELADISARKRFLGYSFAWGGKCVDAFGFHAAVVTVDPTTELEAIGCF